MKRWAMLSVLTICPLWATQPLLASAPVNLTGVVTDSGGTLATAGSVIFTLQGGGSYTAYRVAGSGIIAPSSVVCNITATNPNLVCNIWGNDVITPGGTVYRVDFKPAGKPTQTWNNVYILGSTYDLANPTIQPPSVPQNSFVVPAGSIPNNLIPAAD